MGTQSVSQCFGCGVVGEGEVDFDDGNFYCFTCWLVYHAARARLLQDTAHVQPACNLQGVAYAPGSAQHERGVGDVSLTFGRRPQLQRPSACTERCTVQNTSFIFEQRAQRACTQITTQAAHEYDLEAEFTHVGTRFSIGLLMQPGKSSRTTGLPTKPFGRPWAHGSPLCACGSSLGLFGLCPHMALSSHGSVD